MKVNQKDLIKEVAENTGFKVADVRLILTTFINITKKHLLEGNSVNLMKFVKFKIEEVAAKKAYNFSLKQTSELPKRNLPKAEFNPEFTKRIKNAGK